MNVALRDDVICVSEGFTERRESKKGDWRREFYEGKEQRHDEKANGEIGKAQGSLTPNVFLQMVATTMISPATGL